MLTQDLIQMGYRGEEFAREQVLQLLNIPNYSYEYYQLLALANSLSRAEYGSKGYVFAQLGINGEPCSVNCKFCSMGSGHYVLDGSWKKSKEEIVREVNSLLDGKPDDLFLMTTADYPLEEYLSIATEVKKILPDKIRFVANIGDFDKNFAMKLKEVGFTGAYHIVRLREGIDTTVEPKQRVQTLEAITKAGLDLYYCIEPIGPEHSYEEIVEEMFRAKQYDVKVMAVMRRVPVPGTPLFEKGSISAGELTKIVAVTRIVTRPSRAMNVHEPTQMALLAGVNQLYAEVGANPRDKISDTLKNRGFSMEKAWQMLWEAGYHQ